MDCAICLETLWSELPVFKLKACGHSFHDTCISPLIQKKVPSKIFQRKHFLEPIVLYEDSYFFACPCCRKKYAQDFEKKCVSPILAIFQYQDCLIHILFETSQLMAYLTDSEVKFICGLGSKQKRECLFSMEQVFHKFEMFVKKFANQNQSTVFHDRFEKVFDFERNTFLVNLEGNFEYCFVRGLSSNYESQSKNSIQSFSMCDVTSIPYRNGHVSSDFLRMQGLSFELGVFPFLLNVLFSSV